MASKNEKIDFIPSSLYDQIVNCMPIVSVEAVILIGEALLFLRRNNEPVKGEWWFPGGRVRKGEPFENALKREISEETGLQIRKYKLINVYSRVFPERHDVTVVYLCSWTEGKITLNNEHSEYALFNSAPECLHKYLKEVIQDCNLKFKL
jgi:colanic acid biosynthesis protein WcaH